jgi:succinyl-diaminopimelate desuccinylase
LDSGSEKFAPSRVELTSIDVGNDIRNVIPQIATARLNVRFNDCWSVDGLKTHIKSQIPDGVDAAFEMSGYPFIGSRDEFIEFVCGAIKRVTNNAPAVGTAGGNSDALYIREITDVVEVGAPVSGAHVADEFVTEGDLIKLRRIYHSIIDCFCEWR